MELKIETSGIRGHMLKVRATRCGTVIVRAANDFGDDIAQVVTGHKRSKEICFSVVIPANATELIVTYEGGNLEAHTDRGELMSAARYRIEQARDFAKRHGVELVGDTTAELIAKALEANRP